ncbi:hypothetical protein LTR50_007346 [Elasticomyces elasticus]|nr:hypothetical protein LTR50_007346 [Elasticomyces elasticus]
MAIFLFCFVRKWVVRFLWVRTWCGAEQPYSRPYCAANSSTYHASAATPSYYFFNFSYNTTETVRTATAVTSTLRPTSAVSYDAENWRPNATAPADAADLYGRAAWSSLWDAAYLTGFTTWFYSPTPVPTSELVYPPPLDLPPCDCLSISKDFILGAAGSAAQIEGAIADEGRSPALPDISSASPKILGVPDGGPANDDTTMENYCLCKQDIVRIAAIGLKYNSFSIPMSRILLFARPGTPVNSLGVKHYSDLIEFTISQGMEPIVSLIHSDTLLQFFRPSVTDLLCERVCYGYSNGSYQAAGFQDAFVIYGKIFMAQYVDRVPI